MPRKYPPTSFRWTLVLATCEPHNFSIAFVGMNIEKSSRIFVAGHRGLVGSAIWRELDRQGFDHLLTRTRAELNLLDTLAVERFYSESQPEFVFVAAAKVGGIFANERQPASFLYE